VCEKGKDRPFALLAAQKFSNCAIQYVFDIATTDRIQHAQE